LDNIVLMALRKEPARRYASVGQFAEDIRRYQAGLPVLAQTDSFRYRTSKFVKRNKIAAVAAALVLLSLVGGLLATLWQNRIAQAERDRARAAQAKAERINKFLQATLGAPDPTKEGREVKVLDVLAQAAQRADTEFAAQPEVLAEVKRTIGRTFYSLEFYEQAEPALRDALRIYRQTYGENHPSTATCLRDWANVLVYQDKTAEALPHLQQAVAMQRQRPPDTPNEFAETLLSLGAVFYYQGDDAAKNQARQIYTEAVAYCRQNLPPDAPLLANALNELANTSDNDAAIALYRQSTAILRRRPELKPELATQLANLGLTLHLVRQFDEAEAALRESLQMKREIFGADSPQVAIVLTYLSRALYDKGDAVQAETTAREALAIQQRKLPANHRDIMASCAALGRALLKNGHFAEATKHLRRAHDLMLARYSADDERVKTLAAALAECRAKGRRG
jgi:serine/threonine-protein kinase